MTTLLTRLRANRRQTLLGLLLLVAVLVTLVFGARLVNRLLYRPSREPVREWMNVLYIARSHGIPPQEVAAAIGIPAPAPGQRPDLRPLRAIAQERGVTSESLIQLIEARLAQGPPPPSRPWLRRNPAPTPTPTP